MAFAVLIIGAILLPETEVLTASLKKLKGKTDITRMDEQGNIVLSISRKKLEGAGYKYGDVVKVYIAGKTIKMPIVSKSADVDRGKFGSVAEMISRQFLDDTDIPVAFGFPAGHGDINYPMLMGEMTELEVGSDEFTLKFGAVD